MEQSYTTGEAAKMLSMPSRTLRRYVVDKKINATQHPITHRWRLSGKDIEEFARTWNAPVTKIEKNTRKGVSTDISKVLHIVEYCRTKEKQLELMSSATLDTSAKSFLQGKIDSLQEVLSYIEKGM